MSRSYKKPFHGIGCCGRAEHRAAKKGMQRDTRRILNHEEEIPSGAYYKKYMHSWQWRPDDGKTYNPSWEKAYRK